MVGLGEENIVSVWLRFLNIEEYTERFLDNGYDDLETVKMIGKDDLKAIGIDSQKDEEMILLSVKILREHGAAWVYLLLGEEEEGASSLSSGKMSLSEDEGSSSSSRKSPSHLPDANWENSKCKCKSDDKYERRDMKGKINIILLYRLYLKSHIFNPIAPMFC